MQSHYFESEANSMGAVDGEMLGVRVADVESNKPIWWPPHIPFGNVTSALESYEGTCTHACKSTFNTLHLR